MSEDKEIQGKQKQLSDIQFGISILLDELRKKNLSFNSYTKPTIFDVFQNYMETMPYDLNSEEEEKYKIRAIEQQLPNMFNFMTTLFNDTIRSFIYDLSSSITQTPLIEKLCRVGYTSFFAGNLSFFKNVYDVDFVSITESSAGGILLTIRLDNKDNKKLFSFIFYTNYDGSSEIYSTKICPVQKVEKDELVSASKLPFKLISVEDFPNNDTKEVVVIGNISGRLGAMVELVPDFTSSKDWNTIVEIFKQFNSNYELIMLQILIDNIKSTMSVILDKDMSPPMPITEQIEWLDNQIDFFQRMSSYLSKISAHYDKSFKNFNKYRDREIPLIGDLLHIDMEYFKYAEEKRAKSVLDALIDSLDVVLGNDTKEKKEQQPKEQPEEIDEATIRSMFG